MMKIDYPVIDMHTHLREYPPLGLRLKNPKNLWNILGREAYFGRVNTFLYMANTEPPLDNIEIIKKSLEIPRYKGVKAMPVSAITKKIEGKEPVDIDNIKPYVAGFSDDGKCLNDLEILKYALRKNVLVLAHLEPEMEMLKKYLEVYSEVGGHLHFQHISKKESVDLIRQAKKEGLKITCETCPHYFYFTYRDMDLIVNPPLGDGDDLNAIIEGLGDGTIDIITSDHAPHNDPFMNGLRGIRVLIPLSSGLVLKNFLTENQLKDKLYLNPKRIIESGGYKLKI
jgi:dihydroorotase